MSVKVKICGVTTAENALLAVESGADFLGLNFCAASPRFVDAGRAREIAAAVRAGGFRGELVGVFVDRPAAEVAAIAAQVGLDRLQFSGDEAPETIAPFAARAIKAFRTGGDPGEDALAAYEDCWAVLFDAPHRALYGGTGESWAYAAVAPLARSGRRVFLAGGLGPDNVRQAIAACRPYAIDVCSRVESAPGCKDPELLRRLFEEVRHGEAGSAS
ncbi:MAG TPA: phosphoribosylanthranilate isomerase [Thermoanaerobaculia bacterium]